MDTTIHTTITMVDVTVSLCLCSTSLVKLDLDICKGAQGAKVSKDVTGKLDNVFVSSSTFK